MSNQQNDIIREYRHENDLCQECGKKLDWPAQMANMAIPSQNVEAGIARNDICKECRRTSANSSTLKTQ